MQLTAEQLAHVRAFADIPAPGQVSVWDFPRPPALVRETQTIEVHWGNTLAPQTAPHPSA